MPCGGWCPAGRKANDGPLDARYPLQETPSAGYAERNEWNVRDSDGTVLLVWEQLMPGGGTALTEKFAKQLGRPCLVLDVAVVEDRAQAAVTLAEWCKAQSVRVLNVAGPSEDPKSPVYAPSLQVLLAALSGTA
ncbi:unnamed protein product [Polarella glacialis]|nr:unnamed protein product [Polarella glacialis]CAE8625866.1 unnamed protein product [Polarella glacialis]CAE8705267.1 unnamed protein product [Polarella glacialis]